MSGVYLWVNRRGQIERQEYQTRPEPEVSERDIDHIDDDDGDGAAHDSDAAAPSSAEAAAPRISRAESQRLSEVRTKALSVALASHTDGRLALAVLCASIVGWGGPLAINPQPWSDLSVRDPNKDFADLLAKYAGLPLPDLLSKAAFLIASLTDVRDSTTGHRRSDTDTAALIARMDPEHYRAALASEFDAEAYLARMPATEVDSVAAELGVSLTGATKKAAKVAAVAPKAKAVGWLPPELRTMHYQEPPHADA
jgi:hypothetical protein